MPRNRPGFDPRFAPESRIHQRAMTLAANQTAPARRQEIAAPEILERPFFADAFRHAKELMEVSGDIEYQSVECRRSAARSRVS